MESYIYCLRVIFFFLDILMLSMKIMLQTKLFRAHSLKVKHTAHDGRNMGSTPVGHMFCNWLHMMQGEFLLLYGVIMLACLLVCLTNCFIVIIGLVLVFSTVSVFLLLVGVEFLAFVLFVVYVGAVIIILLFVVLMIAFKEDKIVYSRLGIFFFTLTGYVVGVDLQENICIEELGKVVDVLVGIVYPIHEVGHFVGQYQICESSFRTYLFTDVEFVGYVLYTNVGLQLIFVCILLCISLLGCLFVVFGIT